MLKGTVTFEAQFKGQRVKFPKLEYNPNVAGVDKVEIESDGERLLSTIHLASVPTQDEGEKLAFKVNATALNRIAFHYDVAILSGHATGHQFLPLNPKPGEKGTVGISRRIMWGYEPACADVPPGQLKTQLEQAVPPGEHRFGLFRSALRSTSPAEAFMHLYNLLLMIFNDKQGALDKFIVAEEPKVAQTPSPHVAGVNETVYTRLRNELGHTRAGVDIEQSKQEMAEHLPGLIKLVKCAIETKP